MSDETNSVLLDEQRRMSSRQEVKASNPANSLRLMGCARLIQWLIRRKRKVC